MPRLYKPKNSNNYYVDFGRDAGGRVSTGTDDYDEAKDIADSLAAKMRLQKLGLLAKDEEVATASGIQLEAFATKYEQFMLVTFPETPKTAEGARSAFGSLKEFFGKKDPVLSELTEPDVERWKVWLLSTPGKRSKGTAGRSRNTLAIYYRALHAAFNRAVVWQDALTNPFSDAERPQEVHSEEAEYFDDQQLAQLYAATKSDDPKKQVPREVIEISEFYLYSGTRRNEGIFCEVQDIDLKNRILRVPGRKPKFGHRTKSGKSRDVPINDLLMALFLRRLERREGDKVLRSTTLLFPSHDQHGKPRPAPWGEDAVTKRFGRWVKLAGLPKSLTVHSLRHTFASHLVKLGVSLELVGELLGHSSVVVTKIYAHLQPSELDWVIDLLDFDQSSIVDRIQRGKEARAEVFGRRKLSKLAEDQAKEIEALRSEIDNLKQRND